MLVKIDVGGLINPHASGLLPISSLGQEETSYTLSWCNAAELELISPSHTLPLATHCGRTWGLLWSPHKGRFSSQKCSGGTKATLMHTQGLTEKGTLNFLPVSQTGEGYGGWE